MNLTERRGLRSAMRQSPLFAACTDRDLDAIRRHAVVTHVPEGGTIHPRSAPVRAVYVLLDGSASAANGAGAVPIEAGGSYGERVVLSGARGDVEITAETGATVLVLGAREFVGLCGELPNLGLSAARVVARA